jgi:MoaA/NifB/PqqE/SkfB family radical SAM enzyme
MVEMIENLPLDIIERINMKLMVYTTKGIVETHNSIWGDKYPATVSCMPDDFQPEKINVDILHEQVMEIKRRFGHFCNMYFDLDKAYLEKYFYQSQDFLDATRCIMPWFVAQITSSGDLIAMTRCYNIKLGNVMNRPFADVWNGEKMREFRRDLQRHGRFPGCARCEGMLSH